MKKNTNAKDVRWDLSSLYSGIDDPQIDADLAELTKKAKYFHATHKGKLAQTLGKAIVDYSEIEMLANKIFEYIFLRQSTNVTDSKVKAKMAAGQTAWSQAAGEYLTFFELELVALEDATLGELYKSNAVVARHRPWIEHQRVFKPYVLSEPVESALTKRSSFGPHAWSEFFDEVEADLQFEYRNEKKTLTEILNILTESKDMKERAEVMSLINAGLSGYFAKYSAQTLYVVAGKDAVERKERGYHHPMEARNRDNQISDDAVDALHKAIIEVAGPLARRYYRLKAAHLGLPTLAWSDRNAPMPFADTSKVPFGEAMTIVLRAYKSFSPILSRIIQDFERNGRIDAPATKGKRGGAFNSSSVLPGGKPASYTFLNYLGSNRDVMTLGHELGHGVNGILAGEAQGPLMSDTPILRAETASVFGEMTTFNFLKDRLLASGNKEALLALVMGKIDDMINTVVRQIGFSNFERRLHGMDASYTQWLEPTKLSVEELNTIWLQTLKELYGEEGDVFTYENAEYLWTYVSHFHRPFYVYGYAFGELLTQNLYALRPTLGDRFEPLYLDFLRCGSTKDVVSLLEPFGLDPTDKSFYTRGIEAGLGALVEEAERLSAEMGVSL